MKNVAKELIVRGYDAECIEVEKNGVKVLGVRVGIGSNMSPVFYDMSADEIVNQLDCIEVPEIDAKLIGSKRYILANAIPCVARKANENAMSMNYLDFELYWRVKVNDGTYVLTKQIAENADIGLSELLDIRDSYNVKTMAQKICEITGLSMDEIGIPDDEKMWVATNADTFYGAAVMLDMGFLLNFADKLNVDGFYVLPSSIHEALFVIDDGCAQEELNIMVKDVNAKEVSPEERIADHAYYFDAVKVELRICK